MQEQTMLKILKQGSIWKHETKLMTCHYSKEPENNVFDIILWNMLGIYQRCIKFFASHLWLTAVCMINPILTWREGGWVLFRLTDSSVVVFMNQMLKNCNRSTPLTSKIGHKNRKERKYFRNQTWIKLKCFNKLAIIMVM